MDKIILISDKHGLQRYASYTIILQHSDRCNLLIKNATKYYKRNGF